MRRNRRQEVHGVTGIGGEQVFQTRETVSRRYAEAVRNGMEALFVGVTDENPLHVGMVLVDRYERAAEVQTDHGKTNRGRHGNSLWVPLFPQFTAMTSCQ